MEDLAITTESISRQSGTEQADPPIPQCRIRNKRA